MNRSVFNADVGWVPDYDAAYAIVGASPNPFVREPAAIAQFGTPAEYEDYAGPAYVPLPDAQYRKEALAIVSGHFDNMLAYGAPLEVRHGDLVIQHQFPQAHTGAGLEIYGAWDPFPGHPEPG